MAKNQERKTLDRNKIPPTVDMVREYCIERKNNVCAEQFVSHYESKGWKIGKSPMKDWQAAVRTWENNDRRYYNETHNITINEIPGKQQKQQEPVVSMEMRFMQDDITEIKKTMKHMQTALSEFLDENDGIKTELQEIEQRVAELEEKKHGWFSRRKRRSA